jgi:alkanesulfonate monooxygenase SsuD/methylene tetrahydromethanopterin reductase-like flavin-dependent oxidoreductase (luciferase family)
VDRGTGPLLGKIHAGQGPGALAATDTATACADLDGRARGKGHTPGREIGCNLLATIGPDPSPGYVDELTKLGRNAADFSIAQLRLVYLAETEARAWEEAQAHIFSMMEFYGQILAEANDVPGDNEVFPFKSPRELRESPFGRAAMIGTADQVARKMEQFRNSFLCTHLIMSTQLPGLDPKKATTSLELFAKEIMPAFRET